MEKSLDLLLLTDIMPTIAPFNKNHTDITEKICTPPPVIYIMKANKRRKIRSCFLRERSNPNVHDYSPCMGTFLAGAIATSQAFCSRIFVKSAVGTSNACAFEVEV